VNRSSAKTNAGYSIAVVVAAVSIGVLIGYEQWGSTDALVSAVEKEMAMKQPTSSVWKRAGEMELRLVNNINDTAGARNVDAAQNRLPDRGIAVGQGTTANTEAKR
jgi:hypothetical protein